MPFGSDVEGVSVGEDSPAGFSDTTRVEGVDRGPAFFPSPTNRSSSGENLIEGFGEVEGFPEETIEPSTMFGNEGEAGGRGIVVGNSVFYSKLIRVEEDVIIDEGGIRDVVEKGGSSIGNPT
jgi:hypothetical protein